MESTAARVPRELFVVGCPRSGTTWVQLLLAQHPAVATAPETQIFAYYLDHFERQWVHEHTGVGSKLQGAAGLSRLLSDDEFDELCRQTARFVLDRIAARNPAADVVVEKSPKHALTAQFIRRVLPRARFLHVIRDPRDTAVSLMAAGRSWGAGWAPRSPVAAARLWRESLLEGRKAADAGDELYREIRYETLRASPVTELSSIFQWLGLSSDMASCEQAVAACDLPTLQQSASSADLPIPGERSPRGFFRKGAVGGWKDELSAADVRIIENICADAMDELGYTRVGGGRVVAGTRMISYNAIARIRDSIDWQLTRLLRSI